MEGFDDGAASILADPWAVFGGMVADGGLNLIERADER